MTPDTRYRIPNTQSPIPNIPKPTRIVKVLAIPATGAGYVEDLAVLRANFVPLPQRFTAAPITPGFRAVREVAEAVSVGLVLDPGQVAWGDCVGGATPDQSGQAPVFRAAQGLEAIRRLVVPALEGRELTSFRELAATIDTLRQAAETSLPPAEPEVQDPSLRAFLTALPRAIQATRQPTSQSPISQFPNSQLHPAIRYGVSQALLQAVALARGVTMAEVIAGEWQLPRPEAPIPIHARSSHERYYDAERMIVRRVASLPHAEVDNVRDEVGEQGNELVRYARWLKQRIESLGGEGYWPTIHLDVRGALGAISDNNLGRVLGHLYSLEQAVAPYPLRVESPVLMDSRQAQIEAMRTLREYVRGRKMKVQLVADEWVNTPADVQAFVDAGAADMIHLDAAQLGSVHNTVEGVLACRAGQVAALVGGGLAETGLAARACVHVALAARPHLLMAEPGAGVDEAVCLTQNEMARTLAVIRHGEAS
jgi:methylaspartate ammonia-lyase